MTQMIWQATQHPHVGELMPPKKQLALTAGEPIAARPHPDLEGLLYAIQGHEASEIDAVDAYRDLARKARDPVVRGLMRMLVDDEEHHHRVLNAMAMELRAIASVGGREVRLPARGGEDVDIDALRLLADREKEGAGEMRSLAGQAPGLLGGLFALLLALMAFDSEKHELMLRYVVQELGGQSGQQAET